MPRPPKCRYVEWMPDVTYFKPVGIPLRELEQVVLTVEEVEAIRLKDINKLEQEEGAEKMRISRPTFQRILASARYKLANAIFNGKAIRIEGGNFKIAASRSSEKPTRRYFDAELKNWKSNNKQAGRNIMKIAVATDEGTTISQHYGRAKYYFVLTIEDGKITNKEKREKAGHNNFTPHHTGPIPEGRHGFDSGAVSRHDQMIQSITDCEVVITGGMGWGAYQNLKSRNIEPLITDVDNIDRAIELYLRGQLPNLMERLH